MTKKKAGKAKSRSVRTLPAKLDAKVAGSVRGGSNRAIKTNGAGVQFKWDLKAQKNA